MGTCDAALSCRPEMMGEMSVTASQCAVQTESGST